MEFSGIQELSKEKLLELCGLYAKNWLATDGLWFQAVERHDGFDAALQMDVEMWESYTEIEARRLKEFLGLPQNPGLLGLAKALQFRKNALLNQCETILQGDCLVYRVVTCRVQDARKRKGMAYHTCKPVGIVEYAGFARAIDPHIQTECLSCHPDVADESCNCSWRFTLAEN